MPSFGMDDGGWGSIASGFAEAMSPDPLKKAHMAVLGQQYRHLQLENERQRNVLGAVPGNVDAAMQSYDARFPTAMPMIDGRIQEGPPTEQQQATWEGNRKLARGTQTQAGYLAKSPEDVVRAFYGLPAVQTLQQGGIPADKGQRDVMQAMLGTVGASLHGYDETKMPLTNYVVKDSGGAVIQQGRSRDGLTDASTGQRISTPQGGAVLSAGHADLSPKGLGNEDYRMTTLLGASNDLATKGSGSLTLPKLREAELAIATQYPTAQKYESDARGNKIILGYEEKAIPRQLAPLIAEINSQLYGQRPAQAAPAPAAAAAVGAGPTVAPPVPYPQAMPGAIDPLAASAAAPAAPAAPAAAAAPAPIVPPGAVAAPPTPPTFATPGGVSVTPVPGGGGASTHEAATTAAQVGRAQEARLKLQEKIGYDEQSGALRPNYYVPGMLATTVGEQMGGTASGRGIVKWLDPKAQEYRAEALRWIEPVLRAASGAAIRKEEYGDYIAMFIPEVGDSRQEVLRKLNAMKNWETITARAATANQALSMMDDIAKGSGDSETRRLADRIRVIAAQAKTLDAPIPRDEQQPAAAQGPRVDHNAVDKLLGGP